MTSIPASPAVAGRRPLAPAFAFPVIDLLTGMREAKVLPVTDETPTIRSIRLEPPRAARGIHLPRRPARAAARRHRGGSGHASAVHRLGPVPGCP